MPNDSIISSMSAGVTNKNSWFYLMRIVDKVHNHVCGHANLTDMKLLFERNDLWSDVVEEYLFDTMKIGTSCRATAWPQPSRKVSISSLSTFLNETCCINHFYLDSIRVLHCMDSATLYSATFMVESTALDKSIYGFESC